MNGVDINLRTRVLENVVTFIKRKPLYHRGRLLVRPGLEVVPEDVLGEGQSPLGFRSIHLASELEVSPKKALKYLKRPLGKAIYKGELLAVRSELWGLSKKNLFSPVDGVIVFYDREKGILKIKLQPKMVKMVSGVHGIIERVDEDTNEVIIKTLVSLVYGVAGCGKERGGMLKVLGSSGLVISPRQILEEMKGEILVGGGAILPDALKKAVRIGVTGIISGGVSAADYRSAAGGYVVPTNTIIDIGLTMLVTEGFGSIEIGPDIFSVLKEHDGRFAIMDGSNKCLILPTYDQNAMIDIRKAQLPKNSDSISVEQVKPVELKAGIRVRVIVSPYFGTQGVVDSIDRVSTKLPSGIKTLMVTVRTSSRKLRVPYQNLEAI